MGEVGVTHGLGQVREAHLRRSVAARVARAHVSGPLVLVPEVEFRTGYRRADLLLVTSELTAFEIKSDGDRLDRLPHQAEAYGAVAERAVLVVASRHLDRAVGMVPSWWGVWEARGRDSAGEVVLVERRRGRVQRDVDPFAQVSLLRREELSTELELLGVRKGLSSMGVDEVRRELVRRAGAGLGACVRRQLVGRGSWRARALAVV